MMARCNMTTRPSPDGLPTWISNPRVSAGDTPINSGKLRWDVDNPQRVPMREIYDIVYREIPAAGGDGGPGSNRMVPEQPQYEVIRRRRSPRVGNAKSLETI